MSTCSDLTLIDTLARADTLTVKKRWVMSRCVQHTLRRIYDATGEYIWEFHSDHKSQTLLGSEVVVDKEVEYPHLSLQFLVGDEVIYTTHVDVRRWVTGKQECKR